MFVTRSIDNSEPSAKISPAIMQKIESVNTTIGVATSNNTPDTIVKRDGTGGFSAGTIKATGLEVSSSAKLTLPIKDSAGANIIDIGTNSKYGKTVMPNLTTGTLNLGVGESILPNGTTATANTYIGYNIATSSNSSASYNTAVGESAMRFVGNNNNTAVGHQSLRDLTSGTHNTGVGMNSGYSASFLTTGSQNTLIGALARLSDGTSSNATAIGYQAQADGSNTVQLGNTAVTAVKTSGTLYAAGLESIGTTLTIAGQNNTSVVDIGKGTGVQAINVGNNGTGATAINLGGGSDVVKVNLPLRDSADNRVFNANATSCYVGQNVMPLSSGAMNTGLGTDVGKALTNGIQNTFIGHNAGSNAASGVSYNTAVGKDSLIAVTGNVNTAVGLRSLEKLTSGTNNTAIGAIAGAVGAPITTGSDNVFIGTNAGSTSAERTNGVALGMNSRVDADNCIQLGSSAVTAVKTSGTLYAAGLESIGTNSTLSIASANNTNTVNIGSGSGVQTINLGNTGVGATVINIGGAGDTVNISGTLNNITTTNTQVADKSLVLNSGGTASTAGLAGIYFEEAGDSSNAYVRVSSDRTNIEMRAPLSGTVRLNQSLLTTSDVTFNSVVSTSSLATGTILSTGTVTANGLVLPTTGGTASTLNHYEEYVHNTIFSSATFTGTLGLLFARVGKVVTMTFPFTLNFTAEVTTKLGNSVVVPTRFRPFGTLFSHLEMVDNGTRVDGLVEFIDGYITISPAHSANFITGRAYIVYGFSMTWVLP